MAKPINVGSPEICFTTALGEIRIPILGSPTFLYPSGRRELSGLDNWSIVRSSEGEILRATSRRESDALSFAMETARDDEATTKSFLLSRGGEELLTLSSRNYSTDPDEKGTCARKVAVSVSGTGTFLQMSMALESLTTAVVVVEWNGTEEKMSVDLRSPKWPDSVTSLSVRSEFESRIADKAAPFIDLLGAASDFYWTRMRDAMALSATFASNSADGPSPAYVTMASAICYGLCAAGGALGCVLTGGLGCVLFAFLYGTAGAYCSDALGVATSLGIR